MMSPRQRSFSLRRRPSIRQTPAPPPTSPQARAQLIADADLQAESYCVAKASRLTLIFDPREDDYLYGKVFNCDFDSDAFAVANPGHDPQKEEVYAEEVVLPFLFEATGYSLLDEDLRRVEYTFGFTDPNYQESLYFIIDKMETREEK